jgi:hypothetical protein
MVRASKATDLRKPETRDLTARRPEMTTKLRALIAAGIILGTTALSTLPASASYCYYEWYVDGWGNYAYSWVCY